MTTLFTAYLEFRILMIGFIKIFFTKYVVIYVSMIIKLCEGPWYKMRKIETENVSNDRIISTCVIFTIKKYLK